MTGEIPVTDIRAALKRLDDAATNFAMALAYGANQREIGRRNDPPRETAALRSLSAAQDAARAALAAPAETATELFARARAAGLGQSAAISAYGCADDLHITEARTRTNDELEIDDSPMKSEGDNGAWVSAWIWISDEDVVIYPGEDVGIDHAAEVATAFATVAARDVHAA